MDEAVQCEQLMREVLALYTLTRTGILGMGD